MTTKGESKNQETRQFVVAQKQLPANFPTHLHEGCFWESLGRVVATYGYLEEVLGIAILMFTGTRKYNEEDVRTAFEKWIPQLEHALYDPLGQLIPSYKKAVEEHPDAAIANLNELIEDLKKAKQMRNILCHGSWRRPDKNGAARPFYVTPKKQYVDTAMNSSDLDQVQQKTVKLICAIINTVTQMGWQFPGTDGPGIPI